MNDLLFPGKNQAINQLMEFFKISNLLRYRDGQSNPKSSDRSLLDAYITYYPQKLAGFENELLQIVETSTQETVDYYFSELIQQLSWMGEQLTVAHLHWQIEQWNATALKTFEEAVALKVAQFLTSGERDKYAHLQEYEVTRIASFLFGSYFPEKKIKKVHYRFICIETSLEQIDPDLAEEYYGFIQEQVTLLGQLVQKYERKRSTGQLKVRAFSIKHLPPIVFCEGDIDMELIQKAAELLHQGPLLERVALRYREGYKNLDSLYNLLIKNNWETIPQKKLLLYDCDVEHRNDHSGHIYRRSIPLQVDHPIGKGIENLFPQDTIEKAIAYKLAFFDISRLEGTRRGVPFSEVTTSINKEEKRNFCNYMLDQGTEADFQHFSHIFTFIEALLEGE